MNPFGAERAAEPNVRVAQLTAVSDDNIKLILARCILVEKEMYTALKPGNRIYYYRLDDGKFSYGGKIKKLFYTKAKDLMLVLEGDWASAMGKEFLCYAKNIDRLYCESDVAVLQQIAALKRLSKDENEDEPAQGAGESNPFARH